MILVSIPNNCLDRNDMQENVTIIPIAMDDKMGSNKLRLTTTVWGGALSAFGKNFINLFLMFYDL